MTWSIYAITHRLTGRTYVGRTTRPSERFAEHLKALASGTHKNRWLFGEYLLCGANPDAWEFAILETGIEDKRHAAALERGWMASWPAELCFNRECSSTYKSQVGKSISKAKTGAASSQWSSSRRKRIKAALTGKRQSAETVAHRAKMCSKPCTVGGVIYPSKKALVAALGNGLHGFKSPHFRYLPRT